MSLKSRKTIRTRCILHNHMLFGMIKSLLHECSENIKITPPPPPKNEISIGHDFSLGE